MQPELNNWIAEAWRALHSNSNWMAWNLFLALVPLALSVWLFRERRSLRYSYLWLIGLFLVATFFSKGPLYFQYGLRFLINNRTNYIVWTIALVLIVLDVWMLRQSRSRPLHWWLGFLVFIAFLPNAPYILTDVIHLIYDIRSNQYSEWIITLILIPQYLLFTLVGFEAYVLSLINLGDYLKRQGWSKAIPWVELTLHILSAIGIYLGRFLRFNSWDIISELDNVANSVVDELLGKRPILIMAITFAVIVGLYWLMKQVSLGFIERIRSMMAANRQSAKAESPTA